MIEKGEGYLPQLFLYTTSRPLALSEQTQSARNAQWLTRRSSIREHSLRKKIVSFLAATFRPELLLVYFFLLFSSCQIQRAKKY